MPKQIEVKIPVVVGSNGKWSAYGYSGVEKDGADWGMISENLGEYPAGPSGDPVWPAVERRFMITAVLDVPDENEAPITASKVEAIES